jgi:uncharacterized protein (DUF1778 family)
VRRNRVTSARVNLRIDPKVKALLMKAAGLQRVKLTEFMLGASRSAAEATLAERSRFVLSPRRWREFNAALDAAPREITALRKLFSESSVLEPA